jgi:4-hydroxy-2-oxoheptanedioate aldolase
MFTEATLGPSIVAAGLVGKPVLVRVPVGTKGASSHVLDLGAAGVICPMVNTVAQARDFVAQIKFPPIGARSWGPRRALPFAGLAGRDYLVAANDLLFGFAMIETQEALENLDAILAVPGIDGAFVGPMDLSVSLTAGADVDAQHPKVVEAVKRVAQVSKQHGKVAGIFTLDAVQAARYAALGYRYIALAQDSMFLVAGAEAAVGAARKAVEAA